MKRRICVVITARASYSRIKTALIAIKEHPSLTLLLVLSGSALSEKYGSVINQIRSDGFEIAASFSNIMDGSSPADSVKTVALGMMELSTFFSHNKPDFVITIADRFETSATATSAAFMNIPLVHIQGGEISGNIDDKVRNSITALADYHFVSTRNAGKRVIRMGAKKENVFVTGCPSIDLVFEVLKKPESAFNPLIEYGGVGPSFDINSGYLVVMQHPVTDEYHLSADQTLQTLGAIEELGIPVFWFWPNPDPGTEGVSKMIRTYREHHSDANIHFFKSIEPVHFLRLLKNSLCLIGNSSVGIRECASLGVPVVNIGTRQRGRERARNVIDVPYCSNAIVDAAKKQIAYGHYQPDAIYGNGNSGIAMAEILAKISLDKQIF
jgi:UDP-hydrolysing UDP-N-acetyl-D-glucosamine 2-epimerase